VLYLGFSIIQIIIDLFRGQQNSAFLKIIVMIIFTILLNQLCIGGLTVLSWFIVFIPFIMMTYVTTILLYVFGLNPSKGKHQPDPRRRHRRSPYPYNPQDAGGCAGTEFGCCPDGIMVSDEYGSNCYGDGPHPYYSGNRRQQYSPALTTAPTASCATVAPTSATAVPSVAPTSATAVPSVAPSVAPSVVPSVAPSVAPTTTLAQTLNSDFQSMYSGIQQYI
jgi:hypothetical protein